LRSSGITDDPALLKTRTIGVQSGTIHQDYLDQRLPDVQTKTYNTMEEAELDLEAGRVDAILADKLLMYDWLVKEGAAKGFDFAGKPIDDPILAGNIAVGVAKGNGALKSRLDAAIGQILADGSYEHISERYFPFAIRPQ
jgi:lysine/arginine/ornithine transport system substrate-binding protein